MNMFKEFFECETEREQNEIWHELVNKGYNAFEIYQFDYKGNDGKFHRQVFIFN